MTTAELNATESAVKLAAEHGIDLATVTGTGADGKITQPDVQKLIAPADDKAKTSGKATDFYCPGCGKHSDLPGECVGAEGSFGHAPIVMVDAAELDGDPSDHTPAPASE